MAELTQEAFGSSLWNLTNELAKVDSDAYSGIRNAALLLGFLIVAFQIFVIYWQSHKDDSSSAAHRIMPRLVALFLQVGLITALLTTGGYNFLYRNVIGIPAETIAEAVTVKYIEDYQTLSINLFKEQQNSSKKVWAIVTANFNSLITTWIAGIFFALNSVIVMLFPILQGKFYLYLYYVGPLALVFTFCDYTQGVARSWLSLALAIAWTSVFGSIALLLSVKGGVFANVESGLTTDDWLQTCVYCAASILLLVSAFPIAQYFFGAMGSGLANNPASMIGRVAGGVNQGAAAGAATTAIAGKIMSAVGQKMSKAGGGGSAAGGSNVSSGASSGSGGGSGGSSGSSSSGNGGSSNGASGGSGAGAQSSAVASTVPTNQSLMARVGNAMTKSGDFLNKAGKAAIALNVNSNMPGLSVDRTEKLIDETVKKPQTPDKNGAEV